MKSTSVAVAIVIACCTASSALAQSPEVTAAHKILEKDAGEWKAEIKMFVPGTDQVVTGEGTESNKLFGGGLWLSSQFKGKLEGFDFEGQGHTGYDPQQKAYVGTWVDSMSPYLSMSKGSYDEKTSTLTSMMETVNPENGEKTTVKSVMTYVDAKTRTMTMWNKSPENDEWVKSMEVKYTRK